MSRRTVTANYQSSFSPENIGGNAVRDISKAADLVNDSAFRSGHRKLTVWRTNFMKKFLLYLGGVSLAVLPIRAEAGPHHGGMHGGFRGGYHGRFTRGYYRYHRGYYNRGYGHRFFYPGYYPYYGYGGPGPCFTFS